MSAGDGNPWPSRHLPVEQPAPYQVAPPLPVPSARQIELTDNSISYRIEAEAIGWSVVVTLGLIEIDRRWRLTRDQSRRIGIRLVQKHTRYRRRQIRRQHNSRGRV